MIKLKKKGDSSSPNDLPEALPDVEQQQAKKAIDVARFCPSCGKEARIVSNYLGVRAHCAPCKSNWPVSGQVNLEIPSTLPRGFSKQTIEGPDVNFAYEDIEFDDEYKRQG